MAEGRYTDIELAATEFLIAMGMSEDYDYDMTDDERRQLRARTNLVKGMSMRKTAKKSKKAAKQKKAPRRKFGAAAQFKLPTSRNKPVGDPWRYAYLITGEKKIGKTSLAVQGCEELLVQFDKPTLALEVREQMVTSWKQFSQLLRALEQAAEDETFTYQRVIIDGVAEWYAMCQEHVCKHFGVTHPSEEGFARAWHKLRDDFTDAVNRLLRLQESAKCGVMFIAHAEWREMPQRGGGKIEKLVPNLGAKCEEIVNGKVDGWFVYDYIGEERVLVVLGDATTGAGHRIDGRFMTPDGRKVREVHMGKNPEEALSNFVKAFNNEWPHATFEEWSSARDAEKPKPKPKSTKRALRKVRGK